MRSNEITKEVSTERKGQRTKHSSFNRTLEAFTVLTDEDIPQKGMNF
jgi:hypothetical protein